MPRKTSRPPMYLDRCRLGGSPHPFVLQQVHMEGFAFLVDGSVVAATVERYLNLGKSDGIEFAAPYSEGRTVVLLAFSHIEHVAAKRPPYSQCCWGEELELAVFLFVVRKGQVVPAFFSPYMFVDNPSAIWQGREIYGYPKELAQIEFPSRQNRRRFAVRVHGIDVFRPTTKVDWRDLLELERLVAGSQLASWSSYDQAAEDLNSAVAGVLGVPARRKRAQRVWPPRGPAIFLKQFLDAAAGGAAAYQAIVGANIVVPSFRNGARLGDRWRLRLHDLDSHPMARELGISDGDEPLLSYYMDFDFEITAGKELWRAR